MAVPVITPSNRTMYGKDAAAHFTSSVPVTWTVSQGVLTNAVPLAVDYRPPNITGDYVLTGTAVTGGESTTVVISVTGDFPQQVSWPSDFSPTKMVVTSDSRTGKRGGRVLGNGTLIWRFDLPCLNRSRVQVQELIAFWDNHYPEKWFRVTDQLTGVSALFLSDGDIKGRGQNHAMGDVTNFPVRLYVP